MSKQPKNSPLTIINHEFTVIELSASSSSNPTGELELNTEVNVGIHSEDPLLRTCELCIAFGSAEEDRPAPYTGKITVKGQFQIAEDYAEHRRQQLIEVTATSILYGACREMLANLTARSTHGLLSLPSVSFFDPNSPTAKKAAKKAAKKVTTKVAKKTVKRAARKKTPKPSD